MNPLSRAIRVNCSQATIHSFYLTCRPIYTAAKASSSYVAQTSPRCDWNLHQYRSFTTTGNLQKKRGKGSYEDDLSSTSQPSSTSTPPVDPSDLSDLDADVAKVFTRLRENLAKLRGGGKLNPEVIENLKVKLDKTGSSNAKLGDLAQVVPRGRILNIIAGDKDHIKLITSAIQGSDLSLTPQPDPQNSLQLNINLPPPTTESRQQSVKDAAKLAEGANNAMRAARETQQKKFRKLELDKTLKIRSDDVRKARDKMEKVVQGAIGEVKKIVDSAKKVLES